MSTAGFKRLAKALLGKAHTEDNDLSAIKTAALETINRAVVSFLASRGVEDFKVYTLEYGNFPIVLIKAKPQKKLRFSNIIETQIRNFLRDKLEVEVPAVFWRFKMDYDADPGPEQADYDYDDEVPTVIDAAEKTAPSSPAAAGTEAGEVEDPATVIGELYDARHTLKTGMEVEEVSDTLDFEAFLQESKPRPDEKKPG